MGSVETLAKYRFQRVLEDLAAAKEMLSGGMYAGYHRIGRI